MIHSDVTVRRCLRRSVLLPACLLHLLATTPASRADDRQLLVTGECVSTHVFVLFDTSGSMAGRVDDEGPDYEADSPSSKLYLAKQALFEVLEKAEETHFGFAMFPNKGKNYYMGGGNGQLCTNGCPEPDDRCCANFVGTNKDESCTGWEGNDDREEDWIFQGGNKIYSVLWENDLDAVTGLEYGDMVPLSWESDNRRVIQERLAPSIVEDAPPDFTIEDYFGEQRYSPRNHFRLLDPAQRPFGAKGYTPIANSLKKFRDWYELWKPKAEMADSEFAAEDVAVILLSDGLETCADARPGNDLDSKVRGSRDREPPARAAQLFRGNESCPEMSLANAGSLGDGLGIRTFVIGFKLGDGRDKLETIARCGGTEKAFFPDTKDELVEALGGILSKLEASRRTFAAAARPPTETPAKNKLYLSTFYPVADTAPWPGEIAGFLRPLPRDARGIPIWSDTCEDPGAPDGGEPPGDEGCRLWSAREALLAQAPDPMRDERFRIGLGEEERRVLYALESAPEVVPARHRPFLPPSSESVKLDLYEHGMGLASDRDGWEEQGEEVIEWVLAKKRVEVEDEEGNTEFLDYVLGDIFHSDPIVVGAPVRSAYFSLDLNPTGDDGDGYREFFNRHVNRRHMLLFGSNDGMLHILDAGLPYESPGGEILFDNGTGMEIAAFIPRQALPALRRMAEGGPVEYTVDGRVQVDDVFIDPVNGPSDPPARDDRRWRTIVLGGMREGGSEIFALDVTQPDRLLDGRDLPETLSGGRVPGCIDGKTLEECGNTDFPTVLWEFTDTSDEDGNGAPDLGDTWSTPNSGRILVQEQSPDGTVETRDMFVAIFGGGLDPDKITASDVGSSYRGNFLYMVDIETGGIVYKERLDRVGDRQVYANAAAEPAAVDTDLDGYIDTVYMGTTSGHLFKVDLSGGLTIDPDSGRIADRSPFPIFDTGGQPIFYPPSVLFAGEVGRYALAFGTGNRHDLFEKSEIVSRFFVILDNGFDADTLGLPRTEADYKLVEVDDNSTEENYLFDPPEGKRKGWFLTLSEEERLISQPTSVSGVTAFTTFSPEDAGSLCGGVGTTRAYLVLSTNGNGLLPRDGSGSEDKRDRFRVVDEFTSSPFVDLGGTPDSGGDLCEDQEQLTENMKQLFPDGCRFTNATMDILASRADSGFECLVPVPVCVREKNWMGRK